jgi:Ca2+-binding EF-hand superfamily protein
MPMRRLSLIALVSLAFAASLQAQRLSFEGADVDDDGRVSRDEYRAARERQFDEFDTNRDGVVSSNDFVQNTNFRTSLKDIDRLIATFDVDRNGVVSREDVRVGPLPLFDEADSDHDGFLTQQELAALASIVERRRRASR